LRIAITGTPGVGKTTVGKLLAKELNLPLFNLTELIKEEGLYSEYDEKRDAFVVEPKRLKDFFKDKGSFVAEGLVAHYLPSDYLVILRAHPEELARRLLPRGYSREKVEENVEAEKLAVVATEALELGNFKRVIHLDTTGREPREVVELILSAIKEDRELFEDVDWLEGEDFSP
jgi:adenylate kinase